MTTSGLTATVKPCELRGNIKDRDEQLLRDEGHQPLRVLSRKARQKLGRRTTGVFDDYGRLAEDEEDSRDSESQCNGMV